MCLADCRIWALLVVILDTAAFAVPLAALLIAYVLLARPPRFRDWIEEIYVGRGILAPCDHCQCNAPIRAFQ
jgi:hypothetical protein